MPFKYELGRARVTALSLVLSVACSHTVPTAPPTGKVGRNSAPESEGSTGTRAAPVEERGAHEKGDQGSMGNPAVDEKDVARESPAPPPAASAPQEGNIGLSFGAGGLGMSGAGRAMARKSTAMAAHSPSYAGRGAPLGQTLAPQPIQADDAFNTEAYKGIENNPFRLTAEAPLSTFSVDVDTASYSNMRRFVEEGRLPPDGAVRVEEWVNYFGYDDPAPSDSEPFAVTTEVTECPWASGHELLRVALATKKIEEASVPPRNLVFLIDVSGSMEPANKLPLLKRGLALLARELRPIDTLSIVVYAGASGLALPPTSGAEQSKILTALENLQAGGSTNGAEGISLAYQLAEARFKRGGINRVVLATDGDFNVGVTSEGELERLIEQKRKTGVFLTVLGFGEGNLKDSTMEMLADKGNGNYAYVDSLAEARKVLVRESGATLMTVAKDVKLQLEFNPKRVKSYRLVGYENRVLADQDFNDDTKDAGEMGAGHHVTAFYEIVPAGEKSPVTVPAVDPLKYQTAREPSAASGSEELATVKIRYKAPSGSTSALFTRSVLDHRVPLADASENLRFGVAVAEYALALRHAPGFGRGTFDSARKLALPALGSDATGERREFIALMDRAKTLTAR